MERGSTRKRMGRMRRGGLRWEDMVVKRGGGCECVILYRVSQRLRGARGAKDAKEEFPSNWLPSSFIPPVSAVVSITSSPDPQLCLPPALQKKEKQWKLSIYSCTLPENCQQLFIWIHQNDKPLNITLTQTLRTRCWKQKPKKEKIQMRALSALFYWLLDSWLAPLGGVHLLKEDRGWALLFCLLIVWRY